MPSELDLRFDDMLARVIGPGGRLIIERDELGRAIVANFPATLPSLFRTFCALNGEVERIQRRDYVRVQAGLDVSVRAVEEKIGGNFSVSGSGPDSPCRGGPAGRGAVPPGRRPWFPGASARWPSCACARLR